MKDSLPTERIVAMKIDYVRKHDVVAWLDLAREVEPLFGPMVGQDDFHESLKAAISNKSAYCARDEHGRPLGIVAVSQERNEITWLAVAKSARGRGIGGQLLAHAVSRLDAARPLRIQTFAASVPEGAAARKLYLAAGFVDAVAGDLNTAGLPTVIMEKRVA